MYLSISKKKRERRYNSERSSFSIPNSHSPPVTIIVCVWVGVCVSSHKFWMHMLADIYTFQNTFSSAHPLFNHKWWHTIPVVLYFAFFLINLRETSISVRKKLSHFLFLFNHWMGSIVWRYHSLSYLLMEI